MRLALLLLALPLVAQVAIDAGSASDHYCGGAIWNKANDPAMGSLMPPYNTLRYGASFACTIPVANGTYAVTLQLMEPNKTMVGLRLFSVAANGVTTQIPDLYNYAGTLKYTTYPLPNVTVTAGKIVLQFTATIGNAVVSGILIAPVAPPIPPPSLLISVDADGTIRMHGNVVIEGSETTTGTGPTKWTATRTDGVVCTGMLTPANVIQWACP